MKLQDELFNEGDLYSFKGSWGKSNHGEPLQRLSKHQIMNCLWLSFWVTLNFILFKMCFPLTLTYKFFQAKVLTWSFLCRDPTNCYLQQFLSNEYFRTIPSPYLMGYNSKMQNFFFKVFWSLKSRAKCINWKQHLFAKENLTQR